MDSKGRGLEAGECLVYLRDMEKFESVIEGEWEDDVKEVIEVRLWRVFKVIVKILICIFNMVGGYWEVGSRVVMD